MIRNLKNASNTALSLRTKIRFPEKFKGTIIEKWAKYWKNLGIDYRQALQDLRTDIQDDPKKAFIWTTAVATMFIFSKNNPSETDFKDNLKRITNEVALVSEDCRNPVSLDHIRYIETSYNEGVIHYMNLGVASILYTTDLNTSCDLYKINCPHLKPSYFSFPSRVVDVGFMGNWWNFYIKTANYDVNL